MLRPRGGKRARQGGRRNEHGAKRRKPELKVAEMQSTPGDKRRRELLTPPVGVTAVDVGKLSTGLARLMMDDAAGLRGEITTPTSRKKRTLRRRTLFQASQPAAPASGTPWSVRERRGLVAFVISRRDGSTWTSSNSDAAEFWEDAAKFVLNYSESYHRRTGGACRSKIIKKLRNEFQSPADAERHFMEMERAAAALFTQSHELHTLKLSPPGPAALSYLDCSPLTDLSSLDHHHPLTVLPVPGPPSTDSSTLPGLPFTDSSTLPGPDLPFFYHTSSHSRFSEGPLPDFNAPSRRQRRKAKRLPRRELPTALAARRATLPVHGSLTVRAQFHNRPVDLAPPPSCPVIPFEHSYS